jgi:hypothetical protein
MIQPVTLVLVLAAALLGGVVYLTEVRSSSQPETETAAAPSQKLFAFTEDQVQSFIVKTPLRSIAFRRDDDGNWQMREPERTAADEASVAYLLNLLATASSDRVITAAAAEQRDFGFDQPLATIDVTLGTQERHQLVLGGYDFNRSFIYAQADPPTDSGADLKVLLVSPEFENAVSRPLAEWQSEEPAPAPAAEAEPEAQAEPEEPARSPAAAPQP